MNGVKCKVSAWANNGNGEHLGQGSMKNVGDSVEIAQAHFLSEEFGGLLHFLDLGVTESSVFANIVL